MQDSDDLNSLKAADALYLQNEHIIERGGPSELFVDHVMLAHQPLSVNIQIFLLLDR
jgi:hypothetical protein